MDVWDKVTIITLFFVVALIFLLTVQYVSAESSFTICALLENGAWDCKEKWLIILHDTDRIRCFEVTLKLTHGCAMWGTPNYKGNMPYIEIGNSTGKDAYGNSILWHEIKHLMCKCNWHK